jgi:hypothetical protein
MTLSHVDDVEHWRERAAQVRVLATTMKQIEAQAVMVMLAKDYDKLANRAGLRAKGEVPPRRLVGRKRVLKIRKRSLGFGTTVLASNAFP